LLRHQMTLGKLADILPVQTDGGHFHSDGWKPLSRDRLVE
jgi:hypothetical protein